ncbi:unnamed protein product, partial [Prorocentrum cordatum]
ERMEDLVNDLLVGIEQAQAICTNSISGTLLGMVKPSLQHKLEAVLGDRRWLTEEAAWWDAGLRIDDFTEVGPEPEDEKSTKSTLRHFGDDATTYSEGCRPFLFLHDGGEPVSTVKPPAGHCGDDATTYSEGCRPLPFLHDGGEPVSTVKPPAGHCGDDATTYSEGCRPLPFLHDGGEPVSKVKPPARHCGDDATTYSEGCRPLPFLHDGGGPVSTVKPPARPRRAEAPAQLECLKFHI